MQKVSLDLHDFSVLNNRLDLLTKIKDHYPDFKVSLFTVPYDVVAEKRVEGRILREDTLEHIQDNLDWMQIIPHGLTHMPHEFLNCDASTFKLVVQSIDEVFKKDGLPYEEGFCAPFWEWSEPVVKMLDEMGWWGAVDRDQHEMLRPKRYYEYSHSIAEPFWESQVDVLKLHGHLDGQSKNDLEMNFTNLFKLPSDVEWCYVTEFIDEDNSVQ